MGGISPAPVPYQGNHQGGRDSGGIMPKNQLYLKYGRNFGKLHGDFLDSECKYYLDISSCILSRHLFIS